MERRPVLVIEDDSALRRLLEVTLHLAGYAVTAMDSTLGAMRTVRRLRPDVILLDLGLPYRSGAALLAELKADPDTAGIPVLVVSANTQILSPERRALAAGVLPKPFSAADLLNAVRAASATAR